jgi:hypothetical protein
MTTCGAGRIRLARTRCSTECSVGDAGWARSRRENRGGRGARRGGEGETNLYLHVVVLPEGGVLLQLEPRGGGAVVVAVRQHPGCGGGGDGWDVAGSGQSGGGGGARWSGADGEKKARWGEPGEGSGISKWRAERGDVARFQIWGALQPAGGGPPQVTALNTCFFFTYNLLNVRKSLVAPDLGWSSF